MLYETIRDVSIVFLALFAIYTVVCGYLVVQFHNQVVNETFRNITSAQWNNCTLAKNLLSFKVTDPLSNQSDMQRKAIEICRIFSANVLLPNQSTFVQATTIPYQRNQSHNLSSSQGTLT